MTLFVENMINRGVGVSSHTTLIMERKVKRARLDYSGEVKIIGERKTEISTLSDSDVEEIEKIEDPKSWIDEISRMDVIPFQERQQYDVKIECRGAVMTFPRLYISSPILEALITDNKIVLDGNPETINLLLNWMCRSKKDRQFFLQCLPDQILMGMVKPALKYLPSLYAEIMEILSLRPIANDEGGNLLEKVNLFVETKHELSKLLQTWLMGNHSRDISVIHTMPKAFWETLSSLQGGTYYVLKYDQEYSPEYLKGVYQNRGGLLTRKQLRDLLSDPESRGGADLARMFALEALDRSPSGSIFWG
jgi:hypothetical protein